MFIGIAKLIISTLKTFFVVFRRSPMSKHLRFNAFLMNCAGGHLAPGQWRHGEAAAASYLDPDHWTSLARTLEAGRFDALFLGDVLGVYDVFGGNADAVLRAGAQSPMNDPFPLVAMMAGATRHLSFGVTASSSYEAPYVLARRFTALDHLSRGRIAWNVVTSYLDSGARSLGRNALMSHDERYDLADECLEICYQLWERSWDDAAVVHGARDGLYADPAHIRSVRYRGRHLESEGIFQCEPSPQRTPVLFQAGGSSRGLEFAARHAECVFVGAPTLAGVKRAGAQVRAAVAAAGRDPAGVLIYAMFTVIVDDSDSGAQQRLARYQAQADRAGAAALLSGWTGLDLSRFAETDTVEYVDTAAGQSALASFSKLDPSRTWTVGDAIDFVALGGRGPVVAGSAASVADALQTWAAEADLDGFNLACVETPGTYEDIVRLLVPELQRRDAYPLDYHPGSLREKLSQGGLAARGARVDARHPAASIAADITRN